MVLWPKNSGLSRFNLSENFGEGRSTMDTANQPAATDWLTEQRMLLV